MEIKILVLGEIVGKAGITALKKGLQPLKTAHHVDLVVANAEGATMGFGLGKNHANYIHKLGVDVLTLGEKAYYKKDLVAVLPEMGFVLRPFNFPPEAPGRSYKIVQVADKRIAVLSVIGLSGFDRLYLNNPYTSIPFLLAKLKEKSDCILIHFHSSTTAEKRILLHLLKGQVAAIAGTHCKVLTADTEIFEGTGYISDTGRCGSIQSVGGFAPETEIKKWTTAVPLRSQEWMEGVELQGVLFTLNDDGKCSDATRLRVPVEMPPAEPMPPKEPLCK